jgi:RND family efflux transporter MFP subunit
VLDFADNRLDSRSGTMQLRGVFENKDLLLTPGLFGRIRIPGSPRYKAVLVPDEAISADQDRRIVLVVGADGTVAPKVVRPGPREDGYRVVRQGLTGEEMIVINGLQRARPGAKVTPQPTTLPPSR